MTRSTDSRRARNSASLTIGARRRPASRPSRRRCFLASSRVEPDDRGDLVLGGARLADPGDGVLRVVPAVVALLAGATPAAPRDASVAARPPARPGSSSSASLAGCRPARRSRLARRPRRHRRRTCGGGGRRGDGGGGRRPRRPRRRAVGLVVVVGRRRRPRAPRRRGCRRPAVSASAAGPASWPGFCSAGAFLAVVGWSPSVFSSAPAGRRLPAVWSSSARPVLRVGRAGAAVGSGAWNSSMVVPVPSGAGLGAAARASAAFGGGLLRGRLLGGGLLGRGLLRGGLLRGRRLGRVVGLGRLAVGGLLGGAPSWRRSSWRWSSSRPPSWRRPSSRPPSSPAGVASEVAAPVGFVAPGSSSSIVLSSARARWVQPGVSYAAARGDRAAGAKPSGGGDTLRGCVS